MKVPIEEPSDPILAPSSPSKPSLTETPGQDPSSALFGDLKKKKKKKKVTIQDDQVKILLPAQSCPYSGGHLWKLREPVVMRELSELGDPLELGNPCNLEIPWNRVVLIAPH